MSPNPFEAPRLPSGRPSKFPMIAAYVVSCLTWAFSVGSCTPSITTRRPATCRGLLINRWGVVVVVTMLGLSVVFLGRTIGGQFLPRQTGEHQKPRHADGAFQKQSSATLGDPLLPTCIEQPEGDLSSVAFLFLVRVGSIAG